jgi:hypothetical protein
MTTPCNNGHEVHLCDGCKESTEKVPPASKSEGSSGYGTAMKFGLGFAAATAVALAFPVGLGLAGFSGSGVAPLTYAAAWQSSIGNVAAGSLFASLQYLGTWASMPLSTGLTGVVVSGAAGTAVGAGIQSATNGSSAKETEEIGVNTNISSAAEAKTDVYCRCIVCGIELP